MASAPDEHDHAVKRLQAHPAQCVADGVGVGRHAAHDVASASVVEVGEVKFVEFFEFVADETIDGVLSERSIHICSRNGSRHAPR